MRRANRYAAACALAAAVAAGCGPEAEAPGAAGPAATAAQAAFVDLGNGLVYDEALDITWLKDANLPRTSGYAADGLMTFGEAQAWASGLAFAGVSGWRLPTFDPANTRPAAATSANEIGSLLGALTGGHFTWPSPADTSPFVNLLGGPIEPIYWTGLAADPGFAWDYHMTCG